MSPISDAATAVLSLLAEPRTDTLSFVIPARNEERYIARTIESIRRFAPASCCIEIVVADNGSNDRTAELARAGGAEVLHREVGTVAALRNAGAARTSGAVLVFLDADVLLTPAWRAHIDAVVDDLSRTPNLVTGSRCGVSAEPSWIERAWFRPLLCERANYINSGHLITSRKLFDRIGGFDSQRETGEDSDFSQRARAAGAVIVNNPQLEVIHEGYPKTLPQFFRRERWHGRGNFKSLTTVLSSRIAPLTIAFLALHLLLLASLAWGTPSVAFAAAAMIALICGVSAAAKYGRAPAALPATAHLYYWYYAARSVALLDVLRTRVAAGAAASRRHR